MSQANQIEVRIPETDVIAIKAAIETLRSTLLPHLKTLATKDRRKLLKMGDKTVAFVQKSFEYGKQYKNLVPGFLEMKAFEADIAAITQMQEMSRALAPLCEALDDSLMLSGSEAFQGALMFYQNVKGAAKAKDPDAKLILADLSDHFDRANKKA